MEGYFENPRNFSFYKSKIKRSTAKLKVAHLYKTKPFVNTKYATSVNKFAMGRKDQNIIPEIKYSQRKKTF